MEGVIALSALMIASILFAIASILVHDVFIKEEK